jgi:hypothetical protein
LCRVEKERPVEKPDDLRKLAEWYRSMAEVGHTDECGWRKRFAEYLERRAALLEKAESSPDARGRLQTPLAQKSLPVT